ncbi:MAG: hypothetical protein K0S63_611 [Gammaproteobacteria bacterium]|nr:hypothetical protein [Gammaproteobacteria bacterium]
MYPAGENSSERLVHANDKEDLKSHCIRTIKWNTNFERNDKQKRRDR